RSVAGQRRHDAGHQVDGPHAAIVQVGDIEHFSAAGEGDAVNPAELCDRGPAAVAGEPLRAGAGERGDDPRSAVNLADPVVPGVGDEDVPGRRHDEAVRAVQFRLNT